MNIQEKADGEEEEKKSHESKLEINLLSFTTLYYMVSELELHIPLSILSCILAKLIFKNFFVEIYFSSPNILQSFYL